MSTTYVDGTTPLDAVHLNALQQKVEKGQANGYASLDATTKVPVAQIPLTVVSYGTTLPASPVDGQEAILVDSATNPSYQWRFRYNAGSTSAYKWEFVGGPPAAAIVNTDEAMGAAGSWVDLATVGPRVVVPRAGDYVASGNAVVYTTGAVGSGLQLGIANGAATPTLITIANEPVSGYLVNMVIVGQVVSGLAASSDIRLRYQSGNPTGHASNRMISVSPIRVS